MVPGVKSNSGFSLIELLVAIVVISVAIMALMELGIIVGLNNMRNEIRNRSVEILSNNLHNVTTLPFDSINTTYLNSNFSLCSTDDISLRNFTIQNCSIMWNVVGLKSSSITIGKLIGATIVWDFNGKHQIYSAKTVIKR